MSKLASMNITEFLQARIAEDEALARAASVGMHGEHEDAWDYAGYVLGADRDSTPKQDEFVTVWWPKRVLAECAAKRALLALFHPEDIAEAADREVSFYGIGVENALCALASVYRDHPDYQQDWEPIDPIIRYP